MKRDRSLLISVVAISHAAFAEGGRVDFTYCYNTFVKPLNTSNFTDWRQYFLFNPVTGQQIHPDRPLLSLQGCYNLCHDGYQLWAPEDTLLRLVLWVFPVVVLVAHFHFAPLAADNKLAVIAHLLGDPIDSMWSMLTRQEANRRFFRYAATSLLEGQRAVATIWGAYDELGWQDAPSYFFDHLDEPQNVAAPQLTPTKGPVVAETGVSGIEGNGGIHSNSQASPAEQLGSQAAIAPLPVLDDSNLRSGRSYPKLDETEKYYIELAAQRLTSNRSESQLPTWVAIIGLLGSLMGAYIRTWSLRLNNQTSHTIAVVCLLFIFIPLVKISGNIGAFTSPTAVIDIIQELRRNLCEHDRQRGFRRRRQLFPPLEFGQDPSWDRTQQAKPSDGPHEMYNLTPSFPEAVPLVPLSPAELHEIGNVTVWPKMAGWMGMNSSWRPPKVINTRRVPDNYTYTNRGPVLLASASFMIVMLGSYLPALFLAYFTPLRGFGCRSLAWTMVAASWVISLFLDLGFKRLTTSARKLWAMTIYKDVFISIGFVVTVFIVQLGFFNSCWCRSGALTNPTNAFVDLNGLSNEAWVTGWLLWSFTPGAALVIIAAFIFWAGADGDEARALLNRNLNTRQQDIIHINRLRLELPIEPIDKPPGRFQQILNRLDPRRASNL